MTTQSNHRPVNQQTRQHTYPRQPHSVPAARQFTRDALGDWGIEGQRADDIALCVTELATNALLHGVPPGRGFQLHLRFDAETGVRIEVHDSGDGVPRVATPEVATPEGESGRMLLLVAALSDAWGVGERDPGKVVWCQWKIDPGPGPGLVLGADPEPVTRPARPTPTSAST